MIDHFSTKIKINEDNEINLKIIDTGGNRFYQYRAIYSFIQNSNGIIFVFNLTYEKTFSSVSSLLNLVKDNYNDKYYFLFGNACESSQREVKQEEIDNFIKENNMPFLKLVQKIILI